MAELTPKERLQPSLLDRLTDDEPGKQVESREKRVLSMRQLRASVLRDLNWLLNTANLVGSEDLGHHPLVARSVVNYGIPDLAGATAWGYDVTRLESAVRQAIIDFEPRILKSTLKVRTLKSADEMNRRALGFEIEGQLWAQPAPLALYIRTEVDLETGHVDVADYTTAATE